RLPDDARADELPVTLDQLPVGFGRKDHLRQPRHCERINQSEHYCRDDGHQDCGDKVFHLHSLHFNSVDSVSVARAVGGGLECCDQALPHGRATDTLLQARPSATITRSISLIPMNGMMTPPKP